MLALLDLIDKLSQKKKLIIVVQKNTKKWRGHEGVIWRTYRKHNSKPFPVQNSSKIIREGIANPSKMFQYLWPNRFRLALNVAESRNRIKKQGHEAFGTLKNVMFEPLNTTESGGSARSCLVLFAISTCRWVSQLMLSKLSWAMEQWIIRICFTYMRIFCCHVAVLVGKFLSLVQ